MARETFDAQVQLLVRVLPFVAKEKVFALKGGTAINLFYRDMPRLSVDIDLTYLPIKDRAETLTEIDATLERIGTDLQQSLSGARVRRVDGGGGGDTRILVTQANVDVKIETSPVMRGTVNAHELKTVSPSVEERYGFAEMQVVSFADLFGGKLVAALDRQHPRDLYDVKLLYDNEGLTDELFRTFLVYLVSSNRPIHELLNPGLVNLDAPYRHEFEGMTRDPIPLDELVETRAQLIADIQARLDTRATDFLLSVHDTTPDFDLIGLPGAADLPAVKWKLLNLTKLKTGDPEKHAQQRKEIQRVATS
ncbi:nucleotidyl transferase AbiEii/AbiGii toxin family protein [Tepidicaulis sp.]|uniref:nucleotidyl transferase AbiEii/AbiGii toxin family protein n=1 Tax=Tepidicaulis sp. TaxID=1920809 RepID=UPI003B5A5C3F